MIYTMINCDTGEIVPYREWQRRTCGGLLDEDEGDATGPPRPPPIPQASRSPHPGDRLAAIFFSLEK
jgi:hypothetical protein